jgi:hypothetical protein
MYNLFEARSVPLVQLPAVTFVRVSYDYDTAIGLQEAKINTTIEIYRHVLPVLLGFDI